jgi:hypothetical protein
MILNHSLTLVLSLKGEEIALFHFMEILISDL